MPERRYWMVMEYRCDQCGLVLPFYLEDGCEGPRDVPYEITIQSGPFQGQRNQWWRTASGRRVVPVPFVAGGCPLCQGEAPWHMDRPCLTHTNFRRDRVLGAMVTDLPANAGRFEYPDTHDDPQACGRPVFGVSIEPRR